MRHARKLYCYYSIQSYEYQDSRRKIPVLSFLCRENGRAGSALIAYFVQEINNRGKKQQDMAKKERRKNVLCGAFFTSWLSALLPSVQIQG
jgi:hypothetical protein